MSCLEVRYQYNNRLLEMFFKLEEDEGVSRHKINGQHIRMNDQYCMFEMPDGWRLENTHPDLLALATIFLIYPYAKNEIKLSIGISQGFADLCEKIIKKKVTPVNPNLKMRKAAPDAKLALSYSGGMDSTAALALVPRDTYLFFVDRKMMPGKSGLYNKTSVYYAYDALKKAGRTTFKMITDFEDRLRNPIGFPTDMACTIPCILLADFYPTNSIATGTILESAYRIGHETYLYYPESWHYRVWGGLAQGADVPFSFITAGLSEVATSLIVKRAGYEDIAQSCMRAELHKPCMQCAKCMRKGMLDDALIYGEVKEETVTHFISSPIGKKIMTGDHIHHQNVMMYMASHYHGDNKAMQLFKKRTGADQFNMACLAKWYSPAIKVIAEPYRDYVTKQIKRYVKSMNENEQKFIESWDIKNLVNEDEYNQATNALKVLLGVR